MKFKRKIWYLRQARDCRCQTLHQLSNKSTNRCGTYGTNVKLSLNFHGFCEFGVCTFCILQLYQMFQRMNSFFNLRYVPRVWKCVKCVSCIMVCSVLLCCLILVLNKQCNLPLSSIKFWLKSIVRSAGLLLVITDTANLWTKSDLKGN